MTEEQSQAVRVSEEAESIKASKGIPHVPVWAGQQPQQGRHVEEVKRNVLKNINSSQEEASRAKHLLLVSPEERPLGSDASLQHQLV